MKYRAAAIVVALTAFVCAAGLPLSAHAANDSACRTNGPLVTSGFTFNGTNGSITVLAPSGTNPGQCSTSLGYTFGNTGLGKPRCGTPDRIGESQANQWTGVDLRPS
jgi:hypothetical protein